MCQVGLNNFSQLRSSRDILNPLEYQKNSIYNPQVDIKRKPSDSKTGLTFGQITLDQSQARLMSPNACWRTERMSSFGLQKESDKDFLKFMKVSRLPSIKDFSTAKA